MLEFDTLWKGKYLSVISPKISPYEMVYEKNDAIMLVPIITIKNKNYLVIRKEYCPPYFVKENSEKLFYTIVTGLLENDEPPIAGMLRELQEETGINVLNYDILLEKHNIPNSKIASIRNHFFVIKIKEYELNKAEGDGTENEAKSKSLLLPFNNFNKFLNKDNIDFMLYSSIFIVKNLIKGLQN